METLSQRFEATRHHVGGAWLTFYDTTRTAALEFGQTAEAATTAWAERAKAASKRFGKSAKTASRSWAGETQAATSALAGQSLAAGKQLVEDLRGEGMHWQQLAGSRAMVLRLQAPVGLREVARQGLVRRVELERTALQRLRTALQVIDGALQQRLGMLAQVPANQAELALPPGYDELSARSISTESAHWTQTELVAALTHEQQTKERSTVLGTLERRLEGFAQAS